MVTFLKSRRARDTLRACHDIGYKIAKRIMIFDVTHLMRLERESVTLARDEPTGFTFRFLNGDEVRGHANSENHLTSDLADRIETGYDFCLAALWEDQLAAYGWYALNSIEAAHNRGGSLATGVAMSFPDDMAFMYKGFTLPEFRGIGLYGRVNSAALKELGAFGVTTIISTADWTNWSALNSCWRLGYQDLGLVWRCGWGRWMFTVAPQQGRSIGIRFGRHAVVVPRTSQSRKSRDDGHIIRPE